MWKLINKKSSVSDFSATHWICLDGDEVELYINSKTKIFQLYCFSGIEASFITIDEVDFGEFKNKCDIDKKDFNTICFNIADYLCSLFCEKVKL